VISFAGEYSPNPKNYKIFGGYQEVKREAPKEKKTQGGPKNPFGNKGTQLGRNFWGKLVPTIGSP